MNNSAGNGCNHLTRLGHWTLSAALLMFALASTSAMQAQEEAVRADVSATDQFAAAYSTSNFRYHVLPANTPAGRSALAEKNWGTSMSTTRPKAVAPIATVPAPGFYPEDLVNFKGKVLTSAQQHNVYVDMSVCGGTVALCWGNPAGFLADLSNSTFIHLTDQYVGVATNNRYPNGTAVSASFPLTTGVLGENDLFAIAHAAVVALGGANGYTNIYHLFLPAGVDTCFDLSGVCYSPDNPATFSFCAYHGSVTFSDIGHIIFSIEPYQNVPGCQAAPPDPNGILKDSTNSVLSHELIESITDPDPPTGWVSDSSLLASGAEIGDLCEALGNTAGQFLDPVVTLNGHKYEIQLEYSNTYHACAAVK
jgi:hypothetical protein